MGVVYKARQKSLGRLVALKLLPQESLNDSVRTARFLLEARAIAALKHPNIVTVHQLGRCTAGQFLVMDYLEGPSLDALARKGRLPLPWVLSLMVVVAEAVHHAHSRGVLHRDLKPANILIEGFRRPVLIDFGLAKFLTECSSLTQEGTIMGSPSYMAPEQAGKDLDRVGPASDVYSLGAVLYLLLTGQAPYDEGSFLSTVLKVVAPELPPAVRSLAPEVPPELERICTKCLSKKPADRYPSARALAEDLRRARSCLRRRPSAACPAPVVVLEVAGTGQRLRLAGPRSVLGRAEDCAVVLRAGGVARQHCQLVMGPGRVVVEDLGSTGGTHVNARRVRRARLHDGDQLEVGPYTFRVRLAAT
jgi:serine/threonine protein kinase